MAAPMKLNLTFCCLNKQFLTSALSKHTKQYARCFNRNAVTDSSNELKENDVDSQGFRRYKLRKKGGERSFQERKKDFFKPPPLPPRSTRMPVDQDWTNVWPAAQSFKWSVVPLPIRQGALKRKSEAKGDGFHPDKYANTELIKIPNFLHLTPRHIQKHCDAIKKFCTPWPEELKTEKDMDFHFPVEVITEDFCFAGPSVRDPRARVVTMKFKMSDLEMDKHATEKMQRLIGSRDDKVTLVSDRCPKKKQNYDYLQYLLTALYFESWKVESWESEMTVEDMLDYSWDHSPNKKSIVSLLNIYREKDQSIDDPDKERQLPYLPEEEISEDTVSSLEPVKDYKNAVEDLYNTGENITTINSYRDSVIKLLNVQRKSPNL
ncbi:28S ribosomal protein S35, mitochondrial-like [Mercenaria mercenaria]|uniref:28S ribosomal protein S35, mitochondrial-like n=1 Tax=Mercenaria mercenaria TaxID=6596 RepID=UPI00234E8F20|nr:28S ribosomal protein S35, mitochondrial-like [Mercenaria mercenaria]